jgi:hypothetical protein
LILSKKLKDSTHDKRKLPILRITNTILRRLSSSMDTNFKGKIQMVLASIFPISDKSGVNLKGLYNKNNNNQNLDISSTPLTIPVNGNNTFIDENQKILRNTNTTINKYTNLSSCLINHKFYRQFWILLKYLSNPLKIFSNENTDILDTLESMDDTTNDIVVLDDDISTNKLELFLININKIILFFSKNKINLADKSEAILTYPKYLTSTDLFDLQLNDSSFRKTILLQFLIVLNSFLKPVSQIQKKSFILSEREKNQVNETISKIYMLINSNKLNDFYFKSIFIDEKMWEKWKETGCGSYEKLFDENSLNEFEKFHLEFDRKLNLQKNQIYNPIKQRKLFNIENTQASSSADVNKFLDINVNSNSNLELERFNFYKNFEVNYTYTSSIQNENPFLGDFSERVLRDNDDDVEDNMKISSVDLVILFFNLFF